MSQFIIPPASNPPVLSPEEFDRITNPTHFVDRRVVWNLLHYIEADGFTLSDVDEEKTYHHNQAQRILSTFNEITSLDDCWLCATCDATGKDRFVRLVLGNSGYDVVSDWRIPRFLGGGFDWDALMESFDPRFYL